MSNRSVSASVDLEATSFGLESCCQLMRFVCWTRGTLWEVNPMPASEDTLQDSGHSVDWKMRCNISLPFHLPACRLYSLLFTGGTKRHMARNTCIRELPKTYPGEVGQVPSLRWHKRSGPSGHPPGPLGVCNPTEKQKPPPLQLCPSQTIRRLNRLNRA